MHLKILLLCLFEITLDFKQNILYSIIGHSIGRQKLIEVEAIKPLANLVSYHSASFSMYVFM